MRCDEGGRGASLHYPTSTQVQLLNVRTILDTVHRTTDDTMGRYGLIHPPKHPPQKHTLRLQLRIIRYRRFRSSTRPSPSQANHSNAETHQPRP